MYLFRLLVLRQLNKYLYCDSPNWVFNDFSFFADGSSGSSSSLLYPFNNFLFIFVLFFFRFFFFFRKLESTFLASFSLAFTIELQVLHNFQHNETLMHTSNGIHRNYRQNDGSKATTKKRTKRKKWNGNLCHYLVHRFASQIKKYIEV